MADQAATNDSTTARSSGEILVTFAVKEEMKFFPGGAGIRRYITGMGRDNADHAIAAAVEEIRPRLVLTCGFAGGLNPILKSSEIVFSAEEGSILYDSLQQAGGTPVSFFCARRVAITSEEKQRLWRGMGADAVEMESESIREYCRERDIPAATLRVISDTALEDLPLDFNTLMSPAQKIHYGKLTWALVRAPFKLAELLAFQQKTIDAAKSLGEFLNKVVPTLR